MGLTKGMYSHDHPSPMSHLPSLVDCRAQQGLEGVLEQVHEGGGKDDSCAEVLPDEEEDTRHAYRAKCCRDGRERNG